MAEPPGSLRYRRPLPRTGSGVGETEGENLPEMVHVHKSRAKRYIRAISNENISSDQLGDYEDQYGSTRKGSASQHSQRSATPSEATAEGPRPWHAAYWQLLTGKRVNVLLVFLPLSQLAVALGWGDATVFCCTFVAMVPLAALLGDLTESVAEHVGETAGGLINASFGNAPELVFAVQALRANQIRVVQASLMGSILSNLLLVLGSAFFAGGLFSGKLEQKFNSVSAGANTSLLMMSTLVFFLPVHVANYNNASNANVLIISRLAAIGMLLMYVQLMIFQLKTHAHIYVDSEEATAAAAQAAGRSPSSKHSNSNNSNSSGSGGASASTHLLAQGSPVPVEHVDMDAVPEEEVPMSLACAVTGLATLTLLVALFSEYLVASMDGFAKTFSLTATFIGMVLIPIIGNVVEHIVAVTVAVKDKMELSMGIAIGSACQVSLFVIPMAVLLAWGMDRDLTLNFPRFEVYTYLVVVLIVSHICNGGSSNWLLGSMLITCYLMVALGFWFEKVSPYATTVGMQAAAAAAAAALQPDTLP